MSRADDLRKASEANSLLLKKEREEKEHKARLAQDAKEREYVSNLVTHLRVEIENLLTKAVENGHTYVSYDIENPSAAMITSCQKWPHEIEKMCNNYKEEGFRVHFTYKYIDACGSTSFNSHFVAYFSLSFAKEVEAKVSIDINPSDRC